MCRIEGCGRHEFDYGLCLDHYRDWRGVETVVETPDKKQNAPVAKKATKPRKRTTKKKVDNEELEVRGDE